MRRTVRVAVALVVGQAMLCAAIGWVIFSYSREHAHRDSPVVDQMAAPPAGIPPPPSGLTPIPTRAPTSPAPTTRKTRTTSTRPAEPVPPATIDTPSIEAATGALTFPGLPAGAAPAATSESPQLSQAPSAVPVGTAPTAAASPTPTEAVEEPVVAGAPCNRLGALGRTADGADVRCLPDARGHLRWKIV